VKGLVAKGHEIRVITCHFDEGLEKKKKNAE
jgi:hypothetical protein